MRAVSYNRFGGSEVLEIVSLPDPVPADGEVLVEMKAASVMPADWKLRSGLLNQFFRLALPKIPGRGGAGVVRSAPKSSGLHAGDLVLVSLPVSSPGTQATLVTCTPEHLAKLAADYDVTRAAALVRPGVAAWTCIVSARLQPGMNLLVHGGAGGVGTIAIQLAARLGVRIVATCAAADRDYVLRLGAHAAIAYDSDDFAQHGERYDVVLDNVGGPVHRKSLAVLKPGGRLLYLNASPIEGGPAGEAELVRVDALEKGGGILRSLAEAAAGGKILPSVAKVFDMADMRRAFDAVEHRENRRGQVVLRF